MAFNEMVHAYIAARFYVHLTEAFGDRGKKAFIHGTQHHTEQRGHRMAQLAIRNGEELDYPTYERYGEWVNTEDIKALGCDNQVNVLHWEPNYVFEVTRCPWHEQFKKMGMPEAGEIYCAHLDNSIVRGFNPYLGYEVSQTLHTADRCKHTWRCAGISPNRDIARRSEGLKSFEYHCANSFWAYSEITTAIFASEGEQIAAAVLDDFTKEYGKDMADILMRYRSTNFNVVDSN